MSDDEEDEREGSMANASISAVAPVQRRSSALLPAILGVAVVAGLGFYFRAALFGGAGEVAEAGEATSADTASPASGGPAATGTGAPPATTGPATAGSGSAAPATTGAPAPSGALAAGSTGVPAGLPSAASGPAGVTPPSGLGAPTGSAANPSAAPGPGAATPAAAGTNSPAPAPAGDSAAQLEVARAAYKKRDLEAARSELETLLAANPQHGDGLALLANVQLESGDSDGALGTAKRCTAQPTASADCWLPVAVISEERKAYADAVKAWERYLELAPSGTYASYGQKSLKRLRAKL